jgi:hypothetical protein
LTTLLVALGAFVLANAAAPWTGFNPDESRWISRAHYLSALADPFGPTWADQYMTRGQPPLGSYMMGIGLLLHGRDLETNPPWDFSQQWEENIAGGYKPVPKDLDAGRRTSAVLVALTTVPLIAVARAFVPMRYALLAGLLFAIHPFTVYIGSIAMADALFGLLIALAAWAAVAVAQHPTWTSTVLVGVLLGLGGATKLSPLVVACGLGVAASIPLAVQTLRARRATHGAVLLACRGLVVAVAAFVTFVAVYPYLWSDPVGRTRHLFAFRAEEMANQAADWPVMAVPNRLEALRRVGVNFTERFSLSGSVGLWLTRHPAPLPIRLTEAIVPLGGIAIMAVLAARDGPHSRRVFALAVLGGHVVVTVMGMRSEFDRYHLPMALLGAIAAAVALAWIVSLGRRLRTTMTAVGKPRGASRTATTPVFRNESRWAHAIGASSATSADEGTARQPMRVSGAPPRNRTCGS